MKFSAIIAVSTLAFTSVSALPLEMAYRSASSYYQARDVLPSGHPYPRAAAAAPEATPAPFPEVPPVNPALTSDSPDTVGNDDPYTKRPSSKQRRDAIRARSAVIYEREPEPEAVPEPEPEASPEAEAEPMYEEEDILLDEASRAVLLRRLIAAEEEAAERKADDYIRSFRFHRRAADYASY